MNKAVIGKKIKLLRNMANLTLDRIVVHRFRFVDKRGV